MAVTPQLYGIEFESEAGQALLAAVAGSYGERLARIARVPQRVFGMVAPSAPGLTIIGAESAVEGLAAMTRLGTAGVGLTMAEALASCLGETVERLSAIERAGDVERTAALADVQARISPSVGNLCRRVAATNGVAIDEPFDWVAASDLASGRDILVPADWCLRRPVEGPQRMPNTALSTGVAAGASDEDAAVRAMLELVERDAVALWWIGGRRGRPVGLDTAAGVEAARLLERIRQGHSGRVSWLLDVMTDIGVPCIVAVSVAPDGCRFACGMAARLGVAEAARAAIFEMCQMELAYDIVELKRQQGGDNALNEVDRTHLARSCAIDAAACDLIHPAGAPHPASASGTESEQRPAFMRLQHALQAAGVDVALTALTRETFDVAVVAAVAPDLQRLPSDLITPRLEQVLSETGGGARWTNGIALL